MSKTATTTFSHQYCHSTSALTWCGEPYFPCGAPQASVCFNHTHPPGDTTASCYDTASLHKVHTGNSNTVLVFLSFPCTAVSLSPLHICCFSSQFPSLFISLKTHSQVSPKYFQGQKKNTAVYWH